MTSMTRRLKEAAIDHLACHLRICEVQCSPMTDEQIDQLLWAMKQYWIHQRSATCEPEIEMLRRLR
jgi:hypothetical protein